MSYSIVHRATNPMFKDAVPYAVGFVRLDEGVRLFTNIVDYDPSRLRVGLPVTVRFEETEDPELWVPVFAPTDEAQT